MTTANPAREAGPIVIHIKINDTITVVGTCKIDRNTQYAHVSIKYFNAKIGSTQDHKQ